MSNMTTSNTTSTKANYGITPGEVLSTPTDYTTSIGWKQWEGSIMNLSDELNVWSLDKMWMFIKKLMNQATSLEWKECV